MSINHREKKHAEIESVIGLGELDRLTDAAYESAMSGISIERIASLPKDLALDVVISTAADGLRDGYLRHAGYCQRNRRFFSKWMMVEGEELKLNAVIDRLREGKPCDMDRKPITDKNKRIVKKTLDALLAFDNVMGQVDNDLYGDYAPSEEFEEFFGDFHDLQSAVQDKTIEWCADMMGLPQDDSGDDEDGEFDDIDLCMVGYSRDWLYESWLSILGGYKTVDTFVSEMENDQPVDDEELDGGEQ